jgi:hypothetical protein
MATKLESVIAAIQRLLIELESASRRGLLKTKKVGEMLIRLKGRVRSHNRPWLPFLRKHFAQSVRTAQDSMKIAKDWELLADAIEAEPNLSKDGALRHLRMLRKQSQPDRTSAKDALTALAVVKTGLPTRSSPPAFSFDDGTVTACNPLVACRCPTPLKVTGQVPAKALMRSLEFVRDGKVSIEQQEDQLVVDGRGTTSIEVAPRYPAKQT